MDPLTGLRDYTTRGEVERISRLPGSPDEFLFGDEYRFPCTIETAYRAKQGGLYTLESLVFFLNNSHLKHTDYLQQARANRLQIVSLPDRKPLLDYLQGKINSTDAIQPVLKPAIEEYRPEDPGLFNKRPRAETDGKGSPENQINAENHPGIDWIVLIRVLEKPLKDREAILECRNKNFQHVIAMANKRDEERNVAEKENLQTPNRGIKRAFEEKGFGKNLGIDIGGKYSKQKDGLKGNSRLSSALNTGLKCNSSSVGEGVPIILVPSAFQTLLNMYNVKEFLEDGVYHAPDAKVKEMPKKPECITIQRKSGRDRAGFTFEVRDKPSALSPNDWSRVVAVFVLGKEWQFKDWPFKDHAEIFNKILGFYIRFEDDSVESAKSVRQWNVKIISISKHKRHQDKPAAMEIWDKLDEYMRARRSSSTF